MRERIAAMNADAAIEMWVTFHAFGLELLRKWPPVYVARVTCESLIKQDRSLCWNRNWNKLPLYYFQESLRTSL